MNHGAPIVSHALYCEFWLSCSLKFLEANIVGLIRYWLLKNRIAVLKKADRYRKFQLRYPRLLLLFLWQF
jgi:hypothetical protein